jgi:endonuclease/exonuclease/phosphatase (EEP) superfamily protein YafD
MVAIDHVLLSSGLRALRTDTVTVEGTDHRALLAVVAL